MRHLRAHNVVHGLRRFKSTHTFLQFVSGMLPCCYCVLESDHCDSLGTPKSGDIRTLCANASSLSRITAVRRFCLFQPTNQTCALSRTRSYALRCALASSSTCSRALHVSPWWLASHKRCCALITFGHLLPDLRSHRTA